MGLTKKQRNVYDLIILFLEKNKYPPTVRDICVLTGLKSSSTAHGYMKRLKRHGLLDWEPDKPRTLKVV